MLKVSDGSNTNVSTPTGDPSSIDPSVADLFSNLLSSTNTQQSLTVDPSVSSAANVAAPDPTQLVAAATPQDAVEFLKSATAGFAWAGVRNIGPFQITAALISPWNNTQFLDGSTVGGALGNLAANVGQGLTPNVQQGTWFLSIRTVSQFNGALGTPLILTYNFASNKLEIVPLNPGGSAASSGFFGVSTSGTQNGVPANPNDALVLGFQNFRVGGDLDNGAGQGSVNAGLLVRAVPIEAIMKVVAELLKIVGNSLSSGAAATGPFAPLVAFLGQVSKLGGLLLKDWTMFWGPAFRAEVSINDTNPDNITLSANNSSITLGDLKSGFDQFVSASGDYLRGLAVNAGILPAPQVDVDDILTILPVQDSQGRSSPNTDLISFQVTTALDNGADAFSMVKAAWDVWDAKPNSPNLRANAAAIFYSQDPRMALARDFLTAFYATKDDAGGRVNFANLDAAGRAAVFERSDLKFINRNAFGDFRISNAGNLLGLGGAYGQFVRPNVGEAEFNARMQAFAEQLTRRGIDVNLGVPAIGNALLEARNANPQLGPAENSDAIKSYFARTDLQKVTTSYARADSRSETPVLDIAEIPSLFLSAGTGGGAGGAWPRILDEVSLGRMDLFEALTAVEAAGGASDPTTLAIKRLQTDLPALLTAPLTNREFQVDRDGLAVPPDIASLRQERANLLSAYSADPTFDNLLTALRGRIEIEPQFADVLQGYFSRRNITFLTGSDNLFVSALPGVGTFNSAADLSKLPGTRTENGVTTNPYLPADFFEFAPAGGDYNAVLSQSQGQQIADYITQYDLPPGQEFAVSQLPAFNPGILPPAPGDNPAQLGRDQEGPFVWWDYYSLPNDPNFYYAPGNFGNNPYKVYLDDFANGQPITPKAAEAYQAGGFAGLVRYTLGRPVSDTDVGRPFRFEDFVAANPDLPDAIKADPLKALDYYLKTGIYEGRPTSLSDTTPQIATPPTQPVTNPVAFLDDPQNLLLFLASQPNLTTWVASGNIDGNRLRAIASDYVLRNLDDPAKTAITFSPAAYFAANPTVAAELGNDLTRAAEHYLTVGYLAGLATG